MVCHRGEDEIASSPVLIRTPSSAGSAGETTSTPESIKIRGSQKKSYFLLTSIKFMATNGRRSPSFWTAETTTRLKITFIQACENNIRKISMKKITYDLKENEVERELTIYLSQYILQMYREYLEKKRREINNKNKLNNNIDSNGDYSMDLNDDEESKGHKEESLKSGDKYIIRKLVSLKISPEHIEEYINMLISGTSTNMPASLFPSVNYSDMPTSMNPVPFDNQAYINYPQYNIHHRSNSVYNDTYNSQFVELPNLGSD